MLTIIFLHIATAILFDNKKLQHLQTTEIIVLIFFLYL